MVRTSLKKSLNFVCMKLYEPWIISKSFETKTPNNSEPRSSHDGGGGAAAVCSRTIFFRSRILGIFTL